MKQFKPLEYHRKWQLQYWLLTGERHELKFHNRLPSDIPVMDRIAAKLHYLGSHSHIQNKWYGVERAFFKKHPHY